MRPPAGGEALPVLCAVLLLMFRGSRVLLGLVPACCCSCHLHARWLGSRVARVVVQVSLVVLVAPTMTLAATVDVSDAVNTSEFLWYA